MGDFFMVVSAIGAVILVFVIFAYRRAKASVDKRSDVQKDNDWLYLVMAMLLIALVILGLMYSAGKSKEKENQRPIEEKLRTEEFSYKGHQYIKFKTNRTLDGMSVVHDPNCECQIKKDSI